MTWFTQAFTTVESAENARRRSWPHFGQKLARAVATSMAKPQRGQRGLGLGWDSAIRGAFERTAERPPSKAEDRSEIAGLRAKKGRHALPPRRSLPGARRAAQAPLHR